MPTFIVDDRDSAIKYSKGWVSGGTGDASSEFKSTAHILQTITDGAGAVFIFQGSSVEVFGTVGNRNQGTPSTSSYSIDGGDRDIFTPSAGASAKFRQLFYKSPQLRNGIHTLALGVERGGAFSLDFIRFTRPDPTPTPSFISDPTADPTVDPIPDPTANPAQPKITSILSPSSTPRATSSADATPIPPTTISSIPPIETIPSTTVQTTSQGTQTSTPAQPNPTLIPTATSASKLPIGAIVGIVVGAVFLPLILILIFFCRSRRRATAGVTPFTCSVPIFLTGGVADKDRMATSEQGTVVLLKKARTQAPVLADDPDEGSAADSPPSYRSMV